VGRARIGMTLEPVLYIGMSPTTSIAPYKDVRTYLQNQVMRSGESSLAWRNSLQDLESVTLSVGTP
jgi:hypothetical protein